MEERKIGILAGRAKTPEEVDFIIEIESKEKVIQNLEIGYGVNYFLTKDGKVIITTKAHDVSMCDRGIDYDDVIERGIFLKSKSVKGLLVAKMALGSIISEKTEKIQNKANELLSPLVKNW